MNNKQTGIASQILSAKTAKKATSLLQTAQGFKRISSKTLNRVTRNANRVLRKAA